MLVFILALVRHYSGVVIEDMMKSIHCLQQQQQSPEDNAIELRAKSDSDLDHNGARKKQGAKSDSGVDPRGAKKKDILSSGSHVDTTNTRAVKKTRSKEDDLTSIKAKEPRSKSQIKKCTSEVSKARPNNAADSSRHRSLLRRVKTSHLVPNDTQDLQILGITCERCDTDLTMARGQKASFIKPRGERKTRQ